jgi:Domain of unknown function (DUF4082)/IPT/TIG domain
MKRVLLALLLCTLNCSCHRGGKPAQQSAPMSIWNPDTVPTLADQGGSSTNLELGVKFRTDVAGVVNGIRFYKGSNNTGQHVGHLWTAKGELLGSITFTGESASGWQQANFTSPIQIQPGVTYVASYWSSLGYYSLDRPYFTKGVDNPPLHALTDGVDGANGVYAWPAAFPSQTYQQSNYWVDVSFTASGQTGTGNLTVSGISPATGAEAGGTKTTITGTGFQPGAVALFGGKEATANSVTSPTEMTATTPAGTGTVKVAVKNIDGTSTQNFTFTSVAPPMVSSVYPATGLTSGGTRVAIGGSGFQPGAKVTFGSSEAQSITFVNSTEITCATPATGAAGSVEVAVSNPDGHSATMPAAYIYTKQIIPPTPSGSGLLSGMTPSDYTLPAGWSLVTTQDFESGTGANATAACAKSSARAHEGSYSCGGTLSGSEQNVGWTLNAGIINARHWYLSFWEYDDCPPLIVSGVTYGCMADELFVARPYLQGYGGSLLVEVIIDLFQGYGLSSQPGRTGFEALNGAIIIEPQEVAPPNFSAAYYGQELPVGFGSGWHQWEIDFDPGAPGANAGTVRVWNNGILVHSKGPCNMVSGRDMTNQNLQIGGQYTYTLWHQPDGSCSPYIGAPSSSNSPYPNRYMDFKVPNVCANQAPPNSYGHIWRRYFDDIIVLKKNAPGKGSTYRK